MVYVSNDNGYNQPSKQAALTNRIASEYKAAPTRELEQNIGWLEYQIEECQRKIDLVRKEKRNRERSKTWRDNMNAIAQKYYKIKGKELDFEAMVIDIKKKLDCNDAQARHAGTIVKNWIRRDNLKERNKAIKYWHKAGFSAIEIAERNELSRQQVHNVLNKSKASMFK